MQLGMGISRKSLNLCNLVFNEAPAPVASQSMVPQACLKILMQGHDNHSDKARDNMLQPTVQTNGLGPASFAQDEAACAHPWNTRMS